MAPFYASSALFLLALSANASPLAERSFTTMNKATFDDISVVEPIPSGYQGADWPGWVLATPDRFSGDPYVNYASEFQYARKLDGTPVSIKRTDSSSPWILLKNLKYGCAQPSASTEHPGVPKACTITIKEKCSNPSHSRTYHVDYQPNGAVSPMKNLKFAVKGQTCRKAVSYTFESAGSEVILDNVVLDVISSSEV